MSFRFPLESKKCCGLPSPSVTAWTLVVNPPRLRPVASLRPLFSATGVLVHFDSGTVQHKCCLIDYILLDQICQYVLPYAGLCPCTKSTVHTLPGTKPFGQIPPGNACIQPVYHCIEHFPVAFTWPASLRFSLWWQ